MRKRSIVLAAGLIGCLAVGLIAYVNLRPAKQPTAAPKPSAQAASTFTAAGETVSTAPVTSSTYTSQAKPDEPKRITLPSIGASGFVESEGTTADGHLAVPKNINLAGWYTAAGRPGEPGLSIIEGHVDGPGQAGLFYKLKQLHNGDTFMVERGDGRTLTYQVRNVQAYSEADSLSYLFSQNPRITSQLNLITCGGTFDRQSRNYDKRVIVTAALQT